MKKLLFILLLSIICSCSSNPYLSELDDTLDNAPIYEIEFNLKLDSLRRFLDSCPDEDRWELNRQIFAEYVHYYLDSCNRYSAAMMELAGEDKRKIILSQAARIKLLCRKNCYLDAYDICEAADTSGIDKQTVAVWLYEANTVYNFLATHSLDSIHFQAKTLECAESLQKYDSTSLMYASVKVPILIKDNKLEDALDLVNPLLEKSNGIAYESKANYLKGIVCMAMGDDDAAIPHLVKSACIDARITIKNHRSLYLLAEILLKKGDIKHSSRYLYNTLENNRSCGFEMLLVQHSGLTNLVLSTLKRQNRLRSHLYLCLVLLGVSLCVVLLLALRRQSVHNKRLAQFSANKNVLIAKYIDLSADYINNVDIMKSNLRKTAKEYGANAVVELLKTAPYADEEFGNFRIIFDEFFLWLYPEFVTDVNTIMQDNCQLKSSGIHLNAELRILALIWLGINDRRKISKILHLSPQSIYTYHSLIQKGSLFPEGDFDAHLKMLGNCLEQSALTLPPTRLQPKN